MVQRRWLLKLQDVTEDYKGEYTCVVANEYGEIRWTYTLDVIRKYRGFQ